MMSDPGVVAVERKLFAVIVPGVEIFPLLSIVVALCGVWIVVGDAPVTIALVLRPLMPPPPALGCHAGPEPVISMT
jgi:hypothetical protein